MKNTKKLTSLFAALAMTAQVGISTPLVMAEDVAAEPVTKIGLIHTFDGVEGDWTVPTGLSDSINTTVSYSEEGVEPNYATFKVDGAWDGGNSDTTSPYILADLGDDKIKFEDDKTVVFDAKIKFNGLKESTNRIKVAYNLPESDIESFKLYDKENNNAEFDYRSNMGDSHLLEFIDDTNPAQTYVRYGVGGYWSSAGTWTASDAEPVDGQWFNIVVHVNPGFVFDYYIYDQDGNKLFEKTAQHMNYVTNSDYFENVALVMTHNNFVATTDIDYVKVYNLPTELADNYADYKTAIDVVSVSNVKVDGVALNEVDEATEGTVTFDANGEVAVKRVYYVDLLGDYTQFDISDYVYENNTITFPNGLRNKKEYTVVLDLGGGVEKAITFNGPWVDKIGLIYNQEAETNSTWYANNDAWLLTEEGSEGFVKYVTGEYNWTNIVGRLFIPLGEDMIKFKKDRVIVFETKVNVKRPDGAAGRFGLFYNTEHQICFDGTVKNIMTGHNHGILAGMYDTAAGNAFETIWNKGNWDGQANLGWSGGNSAYKMEGNSVYKMVVKFDKLNDYSVYELYLCNADGSETLVNVHEQSGLGWVTASDYLTSVELGNMSNKVESFEVDYMKVYNVPTEYADSYDSFDGAYNYVELSNIKVDGVDVAKADDVKVGTVTFDTDANVSVKEVYYKAIKGDSSKVAVTDYVFENNTVTFPNGLAGAALYTVVLDLGNGMDKEITFRTEWANKIGLVMNLEGTEEGAWVVANGATATVANNTDEDGTTYARMSDMSANDYMYAALPEDGIKYKDGETIIIDTRVRGTVISSANDARLQIKWNLPATKEESMTLKYNGSDDMTGATYVSGNATSGYTTPYSVGANHLAIGELAHDWIRFSNGNHPDGSRFQQNWKNVDTEEGAQDNKWFRVLIKMNKGFNMQYTVYNEANEIVYNETGKISWVESSDFLKNIAMFSFKSPMTSLDVDYLRIYNLVEGTEENFKVDATINGVDYKEVKRVDVNKVEIEVETAYDVNDAVISYTAWDGTEETLVNGEDYIVTEVGNDKYEIEFTDVLKRSASYTIAVGENATFGFETELDPRTLYYDGFANATSLEDWKVDYSLSETINDVLYAPADYEKLEVKNGKMYVVGDKESDIKSDFPDRYYKVTSGNMYEYKYGEDWKDYEAKFTYSTDNQTQLNLVARHKTFLNGKGLEASYGVSSRQYVEYSKNTNRIYFGNMRGVFAQPMQGQSDVADYDASYNDKADEELTGTQRKMDVLMKIGNRYETTLKVLGDTSYYAIRGLDDGMFYESAENGEMMEIQPDTSKTAGSIALTNGTNNLMIDNITVIDLGLAFAIEGNTKAVTNDGINLVFTKEIDSTDGIVVKNADGEVVPHAAILADDNKTVTLKVAAVAGEYTVEVAGMKAVDGTAMQQTKTFKMITTEGEAYSMEIETVDGTATCTISHPEVLAGAKLYIATYDANGALVSVDSAEITSATTTVTVAKANTVKTFLWNDMKPINY